jgi:hypothetical protein
VGDAHVAIPKSEICLALVFEVKIPSRTRFELDCDLFSRTSVVSCENSAWVVALENAPAKQIKMALKDPAPICFLIRYFPPTTSNLLSITLAIVKLTDGVQLRRRRGEKRTE